MTIPHERTIAIHNTREFLRRLLDRSATPRVPKHIRQEAYWCLRHFPTSLDMSRVSRECPEIFGDYLDAEELQDIDLPFQEIDGEEFLDSPEPNEKLINLMKENK